MRCAAVLAGVRRVKGDGQKAARSELLRVQAGALLLHGAERAAHGHGGEGALRLRLLDMGLIPKTRVRVQKVAPMGDPIQIQIRGYELTIRREDAQRIEIRKEEAV